MDFIVRSPAVKGSDSVYVVLDTLSKCANVISVPELGYSGRSGAVIRELRVKASRVPQKYYHKQGCYVSRCHLAHMLDCIGHGP